MSIKLMTKAFEVKLAPSHKLVLLRLCDYANDNGASCYPSIANLAEAACLSERQTKRVVHALIEAGWVTVIANSNGGAPGETRHYLINVEKLRTGDILSPVTGVTHDTGDKLSRVTPVTETGDTGDMRRVTPVTETGDMGVTLSTIDPSIDPPKNQKQNAPDGAGGLAANNPMTIALPDWINREVWVEFVKMRVKIKKPLTAYAGELIVKDLERLRTAGNEADAVLCRSIQRSWQGVFPLDERRQPQTDRRRALRTGINQQNFAEVPQGQGWGFEDGNR